MSLFMTLLVRNEEDIIDENIRYHAEQGVDKFIVTDNLSTDRTRDILREFERLGLATIIEEKSDNYAQSRWVTRMAHLAADEGADWIINNDADEFWITSTGQSLGDWFGALAGVNCVTAQRHDFVCVDDPNTPFWQRMLWRRVNSTNALGMPLPSKIAHRGSKNVIVQQGNHTVDGFDELKLGGPGLEILHFPIRSAQHYISKIKLGGRAYMQNDELSPMDGITWKEQYKELEDTGHIQFLQANLFSQIDISDMLSRKEIVDDRRLYSELTRLVQRR